ncbi:hypothetical protein PR048_019214 [Dryococelus australis]|uniref:Uncharacterized protein n=1 Tax=Dryococelus australis TaxID=614101 RepID=A0ABQ9H363_9NEOP|nr:hypothetical protein PR048_019214 [Dryococelus australis]
MIFVLALYITKLITSPSTTALINTADVVYVISPGNMHKRSSSRLTSVVTELSNPFVQRQWTRPTRFGLLRAIFSFGFHYSCASVPHGQRIDKYTETKNTYTKQHLHRQHYTDTNTTPTQTSNTRRTPHETNNNRRPLCLRRGWRVAETTYGLRLGTGVILICSVLFHLRICKFSVAEWAMAKVVASHVTRRRSGDCSAPTHGVIQNLTTVSAAKWFRSQLRRLWPQRATETQAAIFERGRRYTIALLPCYRGSIPGKAEVVARNQCSQCPLHRRKRKKNDSFKSRNTFSYIAAPFDGCESHSIPGEVVSVFSHVADVPDDAAGRRVFSGISRFIHPCIPSLLHTPLASPSSAPKTRWQKQPKCLHCTLLHFVRLEARLSACSVKTCAMESRRVTTETLHALRVGTIRRYACVLVSPVSLPRLLTLATGFPRGSIPLLSDANDAQPSCRGETTTASKSQERRASTDRVMIKEVIGYLTRIAKRRENFDVWWVSRRLSDEFGDSTESEDDNDSRNG